MENLKITYQEVTELWQQVVDLKMTFTDSSSPYEILDGIQDILEEWRTRFIGVNNA